MKFPVFKAFGATLAYLTGHAVDLIKALWLPALLLVAAMAAVMPGYLDAAIAMLDLGPTPDPNAVLAVVGPMMSSMGLLLLVSAVLYPMMIVGALRHVVRGDEQKLPFYLGYGGDEVRTLGAYALIIVMMVIAYLVFALAVGVLTGVLTLISPAAGGVGALIALVAGLGALVWFAMRLSATFPAVLATRSLGLAQSWRATKGNSTRLLLFWFLVGLIMLGVGLFYAVAFMGDMMPIYAELIDAGADEAAQQAANLKLMKAQRDLYDFGSAKFWPFTIATYIYTVALMALTSVAAGIAWRFLTDDGAGDAAARKNALAA